MPQQSVYLYGLIIGCEAAFWVVLAAALAARYLLKLERAQSRAAARVARGGPAAAGFTAIDLRSGTPAAFAHGLATAYVGFTIAFGGIMVDWADQRFAHRFASGPAPVPAPTRGWRGSSI